MRFSKTVALPEGVSPGLVIGKKGVVIQSLRNHFGCDLKVDSANRRIEIQSHNLDGIDGVVEQLTSMFAKFKLKGQSSYVHSKNISVLLKDGATSKWQFVEDGLAADEPEFNFALKKFPGTNSETVGFVQRETNWVENMNEVTFQHHAILLDSIENVSSSAKMRIVFGCYKFNLVMAPESLLDWNQLSSLNVSQNIRLKWLGNFAPEQEICAPLYALLSPYFANKWIKCCKVHVSDNLKNSSYTFKFRISEDGISSLKRCVENRVLYSQLACLYGSNYGFRLRYYSKNGETEQARNVAKMISVSATGIPTFLPNTATHMKITSYEVHEKMRILEFGLKFTVTKVNLGNGFGSNSEGTLRLEARLEKKLSKASQTAVSLKEKAEKLCCVNRDMSAAINTCQLCFDDIVGLSATGRCPENHILCPCCFDSYLNSALDKDISILSASKGKISCPINKCTFMYTAVQIASAGNTIVEKWNTVSKKLGELEAVQSQKNEAKNYDLLRSKLESAMNLECPHCQSVFIEYDGCDAVACHACGDYFCGICLHPSRNSQESHSHAATCPAKNLKEADFFSDERTKQESHKSIKKKRVQIILADFSETEATSIREKFASILKFD